MAANTKPEKIYFRVKMQHDEDTLVKLSRMQYDIFCKRNLFFRSIIAAAAIIFGIMNFEAVWGIFLTAYGCYMLTSKYSSSNHTAHKLTKQLKESGLPFPSSEYSFDSTAMHIVSLPERDEMDPLPYSAINSLGEDLNYFYIFRNQYGGYMIPKSALGDEGTDAFRKFILEKTGKLFANRASPLKRLLFRMKKKEDEPYHL